MRRLSVLVSYGKQLVVMWNRADTVRYIKERLADKTGVPCEHQSLVWKSSRLDDSRTCDSYKIPEEALIMMHVASPPMFQIFVKVKNGKSTTIWVERSDTINAVKSKVSEKEGILTADLRFIFSGRDLEGTRTLGD